MTHPKSGVADNVDQAELAKFAARLNALIEASPLTIKALAERTGISLTTLRNYRRAEFGPPYPNLLRLADALDVPVAVLFGQEPLAPQPTNTPILRFQLQRLLTDALVELERQELRQKLRLPPERKAEIITHLVTDALTQQANHVAAANVVQLLDFVANDG